MWPLFLMVLPKYVAFTPAQTVGSSHEKPQGWYRRAEPTLGFSGGQTTSGRWEQELVVGSSLGLL